MPLGRKLIWTKNILILSPITRVGKWSGSVQKLVLLTENPQAVEKAIVEHFSQE